MAAARHTPETQSRARVRGFTLLEVLVALAIVALGMMAVIQAVSETASNSAYLRDKTIAHWVAMNRLTEARLERSPPKIDKTSEEVEMAGRKWRWTMTVQQTPVESIRRIDVAVRLADADEGSSMATVSGFFGTAIAPPGTVVVPLWQGEIDADGRGGRRDENEDERDPREEEQPPPNEPEPEDPSQPEPEPPVDPEPEPSE